MVPHGQGNAIDPGASVVRVCVSRLFPVKYGECLPYDAAFAGAVAVKNRLSGVCIKFNPAIVLFSDAIGNFTPNL